MATACAIPRASANVDVAELHTAARARFKEASAAGAPCAGAAARDRICAREVDAASETPAGSCATGAGSAFVAAPGDADRGVASDAVSVDGTCTEAGDSICPRAGACAGAGVDACASGRVGASVCAPTSVALGAVTAAADAPAWHPLPAVAPLASGADTPPATGAGATATGDGEAAPPTTGASADEAACG